MKDYSQLPVSMIPVVRCKPFPGQARKIFASAKLEELKASIESTGLINAILVMRDTADRGTHFIVAGERRWRCMKTLGRATIAAKVLPPGTDAFTVGLVDNLGREDLNPIEEANGYHLLMDERVMKQADVARLVGKSQSHVSNRVALLKLPDEIQRHIVDEVLTVAHGNLLAARCGSHKEMREVLEACRAKQRGITRIRLTTLKNYLDRRDHLINRLIEQGVRAEVKVARELKDDIVPSGKRFLGVLEGLVGREGEEPDVDAFEEVWQLVPARDRKILLQVLKAIASRTKIIVARLQEAASRRKVA